MYDTINYECVVATYLNFMLFNLWDVLWIYCIVCKIIWLQTYLVIAVIGSIAVFTVNVHDSSPFARIDITSHKFQDLEN